MQLWIVMCSVLLIVSYLFKLFAAFCSQTCFLWDANFQAEQCQAHGTSADVLLGMVST
jgi:hypothetical protein